MKLISWNVNGLRACVQKGFLDYFKETDADFFCIQESKLQEGQIDLDLPGYHQYWNYALKKGYSGTAVFTRKEPLHVSYGLGIEEHDKEGRVITLEYENFYLVTCYTPNSQNELARLPYRMQWEDDFLTYLKQLDSKKPVILCGDLNVAHTEIDLKNPKTNRKNAGFSDEERAKMTTLLDSGFTDTFRYFYPDKEGIYSWWSYRFKAREKNAGWRIDYFITSRRLDDKLKGAAIHTDIPGSDHCPVELTIDL
ncbi:exodeoxyribonuclease III [Roseburia sp. MUC/MUC-530-WT-4D]|uniref:Exodeoxyribonuclease III n=1 Tax=Roseburia porci TaxID=2605790 RepID=A0A6L5YNU1_9FIRM|nr:exodeoxyribonuclease III [Roseburia porci]MCI5516758.1 exodeoxyribonuclease III [Roseburia sp.]MDD6744090.1 exodeoxyribonuclease III [Roseburia porci]MST74164.1 exodeoxyribonuclease III [Roseburia porci]